jgi:hypothetical protein
MTVFTLEALAGRTHLFTRDNSGITLITQHTRGSSKGLAPNNQEVVENKKEKVFWQTVDALVDCFRKLPVSKHHVHKSVACRMLDVKAADGASAGSKLSDLILVLMHHACGMIDLMEQGNKLKIQVVKHGQKDLLLRQQ